MDLIIETDIGHDPDDFLTICYLVSKNVNIRCICVHPGDPDQIAIIKFLIDQLKIDCRICPSKENRSKPSSGGTHYEILNKYKYPLFASLNQSSENALKETLQDFPDSQFFIIGPVTSIGNYLNNNKYKRTTATMQGGFLGYHLHNYDCIKLDKFQGLEYCPTFNMNGDHTAAVKFMSADLDRRFVSKNVCHTVNYDRNKHNDFICMDRASELFKEFMDLYLAKHSGKKLHDPTAAVCHLRPEIANWVKGKIIRKNGGWGTVLDENGDNIIANINYDELWKEIFTRGN